ncbi:hypothetical protein QBC39DRAFT_104139 [Podospora conica]|nr:hypothetical protein QBC39DRAFT_104139 [Schizothecium conicum]
MWLGESRQGTLAPADDHRLRSPAVLPLRSRHDRAKNKQQACLPNNTLLIVRGFRTVLPTECAEHGVRSSHGFPSTALTTSVIGRPDPGSPFKILGVPTRWETTGFYIKPARRHGVLLSSYTHTHSRAGHLDIGPKWEQTYYRASSRATASPSQKPFRKVRPPGRPRDDDPQGAPKTPEPVNLGCFGARPSLVTEQLIPDMTIGPDAWSLAIKDVARRRKHRGGLVVVSRQHRGWKGAFPPSESSDHQPCALLNAIPSTGSPSGRGPNGGLHGQRTTDNAGSERLGGQPRPASVPVSG